MKKIFPLLSLFALCSSAYSATIYVGADGKFYDAISGGTEKALATGDTVGFQTGVTNWTLSSEVSIASLDGATAKGVTVNVGNYGMTFTAQLFANTNAENVVTFEGSKGVVFASSGFSSNKSITPTVYYNITGAPKSIPDINFGVGSNFILGENAYYQNARFSQSSSSNMNFTLLEGAVYKQIGGNNGNWDHMTIRAEKNSVIDIAGGVQILAGQTGAYSDGTMIIRGDVAYSFKLGANNGFEFKSNAKVYQLSDTGSNDVFIYGNVTSSASAGSLVFAQDVTFNSTTLTLNSSNAFVSKVGTYAVEKNEDGSYSPTTAITKTQGDSTFIINASQTLTLILGADQDFGAFVFGSGAKMSITLNGNEFNLGSISGTATSFVINDFVNGLVNMENISNLSANAITAYANINGESTLLTDLEWIARNDGGYTLYSAAVPEPAEVAALFGLVAIAFAMYRRRK